MAAAVDSDSYANLAKMTKSLKEEMEKKGIDPDSLLAPAQQLFLENLSHILASIRVENVAARRLLSSSVTVVVTRIKSDCHEIILEEVAKRKATEEEFKQRLTSLSQYILTYAVNFLLCASSEDKKEFFQFDNKAIRIVIKPTNQFHVHMKPAEAFDTLSSDKSS